MPEWMARVWLFMVVSAEVGCSLLVASSMNHMGKLFGVPGLAWEPATS